MCGVVGGSSEFELDYFERGDGECWRFWAEEEVETGAGDRGEEENGADEEE